MLHSPPLRCWQWFLLLSVSNLIFPCLPTQSNSPVYGIFIEIPLENVETESSPRWQRPVLAMIYNKAGVKCQKSVSWQVDTNIIPCGPGNGVAIRMQFCEHFILVKSQHHTFWTSQFHPLLICIILSTGDERWQCTNKDFTFSFNSFAPHGPTTGACCIYNPINYCRRPGFSISLQLVFSV